MSDDRDIYKMGITELEMELVRANNEAKECRRLLKKLRQREAETREPEERVFHHETGDYRYGPHGIVDPFPGCNH
jgi:hypothetical protein